MYLLSDVINSVGLALDIGGVPLLIRFRGTHGDKHAVAVAGVGHVPPFKRAHFGAAQPATRPGRRNNDREVGVTMTGSRCNTVGRLAALYATNGGRAIPSWLSMGDALAASTGRSGGASWPGGDHARRLRPTRSSEAKLPLDVNPACLSAVIASSSAVAAAMNFVHARSYALEPAFERCKTSE